jgi:hypothetical protein
MIIIYHTQISSLSPMLDSRREREKNESRRKEREEKKEREKNERKRGKAFIHLFIDFIDKDYKQQQPIIIIIKKKNENMSSTTATSAYLKPDYLQPLNSTSFSSSSTSVGHFP